jgi:hypothetical protein
MDNISSFYMSNYEVDFSVDYKKLAPHMQQQKAIPITFPGSYIAPLQQQIFAAPCRNLQELGRIQEHCVTPLRLLQFKL